ncbi:hypothetical protein MKMG_01257 [Methanogenium sp. MK-MG]|nr:hypothetical protein MKMG_01257 [Methanogenium sp. MK-MG]
MNMDSILKKRIIPAVILIIGLILLPVMGVSLVERDVSVLDNTATIKFSVDAEEPFSVGIVETVPEGWNFADNDNSVSSSKNVQIDRKNNQIAFFLSNEESVSYQLTGTGDGKTGFKTEWVDLLYLTPETSEGTERWITLGGNPVAEDNEHSDLDAKATPGFGIFAAVIAFIATGLALIAVNRKEA